MWGETDVWKSRPFLFLCRVRDVFFLFLNIVHVTDSNIILVQIYTKKQKNKPDDWFYLIKVPFVGIYCLLTL